MKYYLDTEFDGWDGPLISLGLVREDGESLYLVYQRTAKTAWVKENVIPHLWSIPNPMPGMAYQVDRKTGVGALGMFFADQSGDAEIICDWVGDVQRLCWALQLGDGRAYNRDFNFKVVFGNKAYPTTLPGAIQHNAWWDARALWYQREKISGK